LLFELGSYGSRIINNYYYKEKTYHSFDRSMVCNADALRLVTKADFGIFREEELFSDILGVPTKYKNLSHPV